MKLIEMDSTENSGQGVMKRTILDKKDRTGQELTGLDMGGQDWTGADRRTGLDRSELD